jgi:hypothetical protein
MNELNRKYKASLDIARRHYANEHLLTPDGPVLVPGSPRQSGYSDIDVPLCDPRRAPKGEMAWVRVSFDGEAVTDHQLVLAS